MRQERAEAFEHKAFELGVAGAALTSRKNWQQQAQELDAVRQQLADASSRAGDVLTQ